MSEKQTDHWSSLVSELGVTPASEPVSEPPVELAEAEPADKEIIDQPVAADVLAPQDVPVEQTATPISTWAPPHRKEPKPHVEEEPRPASDWDLLAEELGIAPAPSPTAMPPSAEEPAGVDYIETPDRLDENFDVFEMPAPLDEPVGVKAEFVSEEEAPAATGEGDESRPRRRRRRRGRRQRGDEREAPAVEGVGDEDEPAATVGDLLADEEEPIAAEPADEQERREERPRRERPRRRRRSKGEKPAAVTDDFGRGIDEPELDSHDEEADDDLASDEMRPAHRAIPTWQEAVGSIIAANMEARGRRSDGGRGRGHRPHR